MGTELLDFGRLIMITNTQTECMQNLAYVTMILERLIFAG